MERVIAKQIYNHLNSIRRNRSNDLVIVWQNNIQDIAATSSKVNELGKSSLNNEFNHCFAYTRTPEQDAAGQSILGQFRSSTTVFACVPLVYTVKQSTNKLRYWSVTTSLLGGLYTTKNRNT